MSGSADESERRKRPLEIGKEMLEKYKMDRLKRSENTPSLRNDEPSDEEAMHNDKSIDFHGLSTNEGLSSRDITRSSISMSEGEGDCDLEGMASRVAELEKLLQEKEAIVEALSTEIDYLSAEAPSPNSSQSQSSSIQGREIISSYRARLQEFEIAINQRDNLIEDLTSSLDQALSARDTLVAQLNTINSMHVPGPNVSNINLPEKVDKLEMTVTEQKLLIHKLNAQLSQMQEHVQTLELEKETRTAEINDYKTQIHNLNDEIRLGTAQKDLNTAENLEHQKQYEARIDKIKQDMQHILEKFTIETNAKTTLHQQELKDLTSKHEAEITNIQMKYEQCLKLMKNENKVLEDRLNKELADLESTHAKELSIFQTQLAHYKKTIKTLKSELVNRTESQRMAEAQVNVYKSEIEDMKVQTENSRHLLELNYEKEKEMLNEQVKLHKIQLEEITAKHLTATALLESKESIEHSLQQALTNAATLRDENNILRFNLEDLSSRYSAAQSLIENNQAHERSMSTRIQDLEKSLSRLSGINVSVFSELNDTTYQTFDEFAIQYQTTQQKLDEKQKLEKLLVEKIRGLEDDISKAKEELEQANRTKKSYEKQLKDMKNLCDKLSSEINMLNDKSNVTVRLSPDSVYVQSTEENRQSDQDAGGTVADFVKEIEQSRQEIEALKRSLEQKDSEIGNYVKLVRELEKKTQAAQDECDKLKSGLAAAWAQCAEVEEKLNQTLAMNESKLDISVPLPVYRGALCNCSKNDSIGNDVACDTVEGGNESEDITSVSTNMKETPSSTDVAFVSKRHVKMLKEMEHLLGKHPNFYIVLEKLYDNVVLCKKLSSEKNQLIQEHVTLKPTQKDAGSLRELLEQLKTEKHELEQQMEELTERYNAEVNAIRTDSVTAIKKVQSLLLSLEKDIESNCDMKSELETRHAQEIKDLRMFFEQKYLQMEKENIGEVLSQLSKKLSDDDKINKISKSRLQFAGAGDGVVISRESDLLIAKSDFGEQSKATSEYQMRIKSFLEELERKKLEIADVNLKCDKTLNDQKKKYENDTKDHYNERADHTLFLKTVDQHCQTEWDVDVLENSELLQLRAAYRRQLEEQVAQARFDIVHALQEQIQTFLLLEEGGEDNWPPELIQLRDKLTSNARQEIRNIKDLHAAEIVQLKEKHSSNISRIIECHQEEISKINANYATQQSNAVQNSSGPSLHELSVIKERDDLQKVCIILKSLIGELIRYFSVCEEEINNTIIAELLKGQVIDSMYIVDKYLECTENSLSEANDKIVDTNNGVLNVTEMKTKRVHFAPQSNELVSIVNSDNTDLINIGGEDEYIIDTLKKQLNTCVHRLRTESAEILGVPLSASEDKSIASANEAIRMNKINDDLKVKMNRTESLILSYRQESERQKIRILELERKLAFADNKREIISEGYGDHDNGADYDVTLQDFSQLQEKARRILSNGGGDSAYLLQLVEQLCTQGDKVMDDAKKEKEDLQQQILAADKQLRATRSFLEEQASEREAERDESAKQICILHEQLKEREREKERDLRISSETSLSRQPTSDTSVLQATDINVAVEALETQMREMSSLMSDTEAKRSEKEGELKAAIEKICVLRDIVSDLEQQLQMKVKREESLQRQIAQLDAVIADQTKNQQELAHELDNMKMGNEDKQMAEHINVLQEELRKHKISSEHFSVNSPVLKQMKAEICEMQNLLDKRINELEAIHVCSSNLSISQPSEDVSIREQIHVTRCVTPDDPTAPPMLPLDQILKLKQKMLKQVRAEEVAFKKIKDLEMHLAAVKGQNEDLLAEQEILQQRASEQLYQMEAMRGRLEQHKQSAPFVQRQATSRLELQLHEANVKLQSLERSIAYKELELSDMKSQLDRIVQLLQEKETEIANLIHVNDDAVQKLKDRLNIVEEENKNLHSKVGVQERAQLELPQLIDSMLADKNEEIDHLKEQLSMKEKQLNVYSALPLHETEIKELMKQADPKNSARTLSDVLSIHSECEEFCEAVRAAPNSSQILPHSVSSLKVPITSVVSQDVSDVSIVPQIEPSKTMEPIPPLNLSSHSDNISTSPRHSRISVEMNPVQCNVSQETTLFSTGDKNKSDLKRASDASNIDAKDMNEFIEANSRKTQQLEDQLNVVKKELESKAILLEQREREVSFLKERCEEIQIELKDTVNTLTHEKIFYKNLHELSQTSEDKIKKDLEEVENILKLKTEILEQYESKIQTNEKIIIKLNAENEALRSNVGESKKDAQIQKYASLVQEKANELEHLNSALLEKDVIIETLQTRNMEIENENKQLYEYKEKYQVCKQELVENKNEVHRLAEGLNNRDQIIMRLEEMAQRTSLTGASSPSDEKDREIHHLQEYIKEKDKVIQQISDDSKSLHRALETIQNKMKESGNVVELRRKLKEERKINAELTTMIESLKKEREYLKETCTQRSQDNTDIEDMVQRELNLSARLDKQIMNIIESDGEKRGETQNVDNLSTGSYEVQTHRTKTPYVNVAEKLLRTEKDMEVLKKLKSQLEIENGVLKRQVAEYEDRIFQMKMDLVDESKKVVKMEKELSTERNVLRSLKIQADKEHKGRLFEHSREVDRIEAELKASLDSEERLRCELSLLRQEYKNSEIKFSSMMGQMQSQGMDNVPRLTDLIEAEKKKYALLAEQHEKEQRKNVELQNTLTEIRAEQKRCETKLEIITEEKEEIISTLALTEGIKDHLETNLKRMKEELKEKQEECRRLQQNIKTMTDAETKRQCQRISEQNELIGLRRQINNARDVMTDLEADMEQSKRELENATEREVTLTRALEIAKAKEVELSEKLRIAKNGEKELKDTIAKLQRDLRVSSKRELDTIKETNDKHANDESRLCDELAKVRMERDQLVLYVKTLESQLKQNHSTQNMHIQRVHAIEKLQYFYGKYLRADSRQKALAYQKCYLLCILKGYMVSEENTLCILAQLTQNERSCTRMTHNRKSPKARFKSVTFVIISIHRMKWLILRWRTGKCIGADTLSANIDNQFKVIRKSSSNHSPPVKDSATASRDPHGSTLEQYCHRLKNIQQTLGFATVESGTSHTVTE